MIYDFFVSYASPDRPLAVQLHDNLKKLGAEVFLDRYSLLPGTAWQAAIQKGILDSKVIVVLISQLSASAIFQQEEVLLALSLEKTEPAQRRICPILIDAECPLPLGLNHLQALALQDVGDSEQLARRLMAFEGEDLASLVVRLEKLLLERDRRRDNRGENHRSSEIMRLSEKIRELFRPAKGTLLAGAILDRPIESGHFGTIWLAHLQSDKSLVATKIFHLDRLTQATMLWRFRRSIKALEQLNIRRDAPRQIVRLIATSTHELAFTMEYLSEGNLEFIQKLGWSLEKKLDVFKKVCKAVSFAHQVGIIHRDIKPANIVLNDEQEPVLTDFDISDISFVTKLSVSTGLGTATFAAPEQLERADEETATPQADVYSLGRLLQFLLLERAPSIRIPPLPKDLESIMDPPLEEAILKATRILPIERYPRVSDLIQSLEDRETGWRRFQIRLARARRRIDANRGPLGIMATLLILALGFGIYQGQIAEQLELQRQKAEEFAKSLSTWSARFEELSNQKETLVTEISRLESSIEQVTLLLSSPDLPSEEARNLISAKAGQIERLRITRAQHSELLARIAEVKNQLAKERNQFRPSATSGINSNQPLGEEEILQPSPTESLQRAVPYVGPDFSLVADGEVGKDFYFELSVDNQISVDNNLILLDSLPPGLIFSSFPPEVTGVPQQAEVRDVMVREMAGKRRTFSVRLAISNGGCALPRQARCGEHCVSLTENPFHSQKCFAVTPNLARPSEPQPPSWELEGVVFYEFRYSWNEDRTAVSIVPRVLGELPPKLKETGILPIGEISADSLAEPGAMLIVPNLAIACVDHGIRRADYRSAPRSTFEKLSTSAVWSPLPSKEWTRSPPSSTDSRLQPVFGNLLNLWSINCASSN